MPKKVKEHFSKSLDMRKLDRSVSWRLSAASRRKKDARRFAQKTLRADCPICGKHRALPLAVIYGFKYVTCPQCTHVYVQNIPTAGRLKAFYENTMKRVAMRPSEDLTQKKMYMTRVNDISLPKVDYITKGLGQKGLWVDIGCGSGELLYAAQKRGWKTIGYEIDPQEIHLARDIFGLDVRRGYLDEKNAAKMLKEADVISLFSVLEHVAAPGKILDLVRHYAKKSAALILELPHHPSVSAYVNMAFPRTVSRHMVPPNHLGLFTDESVKRLLSQNGFTATHIWYYGQDFYELIGTIAALAEFEDKNFTQRLLDETQQFQKIIDQNKLCDEMIVIAKRKGKSHAE